MDWTEEADSLLVKLWEAGGTLDDIAHGFRKAGYAVSRNMVAGRRHRIKDRLKMAERVIVRAPVRRIPEPQPKQIRSKHVSNKKDLRGKAASRLPVTPAELAKADHTDGVDYLDLEAWGCKAILPQRGGAWNLQKCCGRMRDNDYNGSPSPYCATHFRIYTTPAPRR